MRIAWPKALVAELAERRCIIVMGAGVSMGCLGADGKTRPPGWETLLLSLANLVPKATDRAFAKRLINERQYLDAAEVITDCANAADLGDFFRRTFQQPRFAPSGLHELILDVDPKIVITTNYDEVYDRYCTSGKATLGYNICRYYETQAIDNLRSTVRLVIKAHGCITAPAKIVLSRSSYFKARQDHPAFYSTLDALFLTHTLLFIGCSLADPDIQLLLENANIAAPSTHPHYALVEKTRHRSIANAIKRTHNIQLLEYKETDHSQAVDAMRALKESVWEHRSVTA